MSSARCTSFAAYTVSIDDDGPMISTRRWGRRAAFERLRLVGGEETLVD
jgi:hypothetical protein